MQARAVAAGSDTATAPVRLTQLKRGQTGVILDAQLDPGDAALLRAMGLCMAARVRLCRAGEPCIVAVGCGCGGTCRIGLARPLADRIVVHLQP